MKLIDSINVFNHPNVGKYNITIPDDAEHLILTGYNGSGKSSILRALACGGNQELLVTSPKIHSAHIIVWDRKATSDIKLQLESVKEQPAILIIDDIEIGYNPQEQSTFLNRLTAEFPNIQIIGSTHSPFVLSGVYNTAAYSLDNRLTFTNLDQLTIEDVAKRVFGM